MLNPGEQRLLTDAVRPPVDYRLDHAFVSTYSLDLTAFFSIPLILTFGDAQEEGGRPRPGPFALLEAIRRTASHFTVFCQPGEIAVPSSRQRVLGFLEGAIREVSAPAGGVFHPKLWVLRYEPLYESGDPIVYRTICASRNLTFDRSWDVMLVLEGELNGPERALNRPLANFIEDVVSIVDQGADPLDDERREALAQIVGELPRVEFTAPDGLDLVAFHPLGTARSSADPFAGRRDDTLVISPFAGTGKLEDLASGQATLVSAAPELDALRVDPSELFDEVLVLSDLAVGDAVSADSEAENEDADAAESQPEAPVAGVPRERLQDSAAGLLRGLHAKVYSARAGRLGRLWVGSANATGAAFGQNLEFLVELEGRRNAKPDGILGSEDEGLRRLLRPYRRSELTQADQDEREAEFLADCLLHEIGASSPELRAVPAGGEVFNLELHDFPNPSDSRLRRVDGRPASIHADRGVDLLNLDGSATWTNLETAQLTAFLVVRVEVEVGAARIARAATVRARLSGAPENRDAEIIRSIIKSPEQFLRYLAFLLADPDRDPAEAQHLVDAVDEGATNSDPRGGPSPFPVLESMIRAVSEDPPRIARIAALLDDLMATPEGHELIPAGFSDIWEPIAAAHRELEAEGTT